MTDINLYKSTVEDVFRINKLDDVEFTKKMCKLYEEVGELTRLLNMTIGRKVISESKEEIEKHILEELADSIQCAYSLFFTNKNRIQHSERVIGDTRIPLKPKTSLSSHIIKTYQSISELKHESVQQKLLCPVLENLIIIGLYFKISFNDINEIILVKNVKWEEVVKKRKNNNKFWSGIN